MDENVKNTAVDETEVKETENTDAETEETSSEDAGGTADKGIFVQRVAQNAEQDAENSEKAEKTFTQAEVDKLIKERLARVEKKKTKTAEELGAEVAALNQTIAQLTQSNACYKAGIRAECVEDAAALASRLVDDKTDFAAALAKVLEKYPTFSGTSRAQPVKNTSINMQGKKVPEDNSAFYKVLGLKKIEEVN